MTEPQDRRQQEDRRQSFRGSRRLEDYAHGTRGRYQLGCRCLPCKAVEANYSALRYAARAEGDWNGWVKPDAALRYLLWLQAQGIGIRRAAELAHVSVRTIQRIRSGQSQYIRARIERQILNIRPSLAHGVHVNGYRTRQLLAALQGEDYTERELAFRLGLRSGQLQFDYESVTVKTALKVRQLFYRLTGECDGSTR